MASLAIGYRIPTYQRAAGGYNAPETGRRYGSERFVHPHGNTARARGRKGLADLRVAFAKKEGAAAGEGKK